MRIEDRIAQSIKNMHPFVIFRKPNKTEISAVFQNNNSIYFTTDFSENGFIFSPFDDAKNTFLIPFLNVEQFVIKAEQKEYNSTSKLYTSNFKTAREAHIDLVKKGVDFINNSIVDKVVLSRKEVLKSSEFVIFETFEKLLLNYPTAFVYLWFHPKTGLWLGATPERLISIENNKFKVMALASTQVYKDTLDVFWGVKERQEHQFVVDYIVSKIKEYDLEISTTYTVKEGILLHLRADISGEIDEENFSLKNLINKLHPTPATCGVPKELSKKFILENENYNREYYTGFLGEINDNSIDLYVNLRCMKVEEKNISLYIGGGITKSSNPKKEWEETVAKSKVMKRVL